MNIARTAAVVPTTDMTKLVAQRRLSISSDEHIKDNIILCLDVLRSTLEDRLVEFLEDSCEEEFTIDTDPINLLEVKHKSYVIEEVPRLKPIKRTFFQWLFRRPVQYKEAVGHKCRYMDTVLVPKRLISRLGDNAKHWVGKLEKVEVSSSGVAIMEAPHSMDHCNYLYAVDGLGLIQTPATITIDEKKTHVGAYLHYEFRVDHCKRGVFNAVRD